MNEDQALALMTSSVGYLKPEEKGRAGTWVAEVAMFGQHDMFDALTGFGPDPLAAALNLAEVLAAALAADK